MITNNPGQLAPHTLPDNKQNKVLQLGFTERPLVSVVCLCYNQGRFVKEALHSVFSQTYSPVQLIVLDDGSTDNSVAAIKEAIRGKDETIFLAIEKNQGYCKSLNQVLALAKGEFMIDLAADDVLLPHRIEEGVKAFAQLGPEFGVHFSDAEIIDKKNNHWYNHSEKYNHRTIPQGDIYKELIHRYFICSPTLMFRTQVAHAIGGYDESLSFEDFDFLVRASRLFKFAYSTKALVRRRRTRHSMSQQQFRRGSGQRWSTLAVCKKIKQLNQNQEENRALRKRLRYEIVLSLRMLDFPLALGFAKIY